MNGRGVYRTGTVAEKGSYLHPPAEDGAYFPCLIAARLSVGGEGDSGSVVMVRGLPAGITSRNLGGNLGFTPLAEGLAETGLVLCVSPDCGLTPPAVSSAPARESQLTVRPGQPALEGGGHPRPVARAGRHVLSAPWPPP